MRPRLETARDDLDDARGQLAAARAMPVKDRCDGCHGRRAAAIAAAEALITECETRIEICEDIGHALHVLRRRLERARARIRAVPADLGETYESVYKLIRRGGHMPHEGRWITGEGTRSRLTDPGGRQPATTSAPARTNPTHQGGITIMTGLHPAVSPPATVSRAAAEAAAADHALSQLGRPCERPGPTPGLADVLAAGFEAITHGLLAAAAAIEDSGADTADAVTDLGERLATWMARSALSPMRSMTRGPHLRWRRLWHHHREPRHIRGMDGES